MINEEITKKKEFQLFQNKDVEPCIEEILVDVEEIFQKMKDHFRQQFVQEFSRVCKILLKEEIKPGYLMCHLLRTDLLRGEYRSPIVAYDRSWYLHKGVWVGELDTGQLFGLYTKFWENLIQRAKRYVGKVSMPEVDSLMQEMVTPFYRYLKELVLYSIAEATETDSFLCMDKEEDFQIRVGEYMEPGDLVYQEQPEKDMEELKNWLDKNERRAYCFGDFKGLDMGNLMLSNHDFRYADFRGSSLEKSNLSISLLLGACFRNCQMRESNLTGSMLLNTDFTGADLERANLSYGVTYQGKDPGDTFKREGYTGSSFKECNLQGACLAGGVFIGADFRGARLMGCDFQETSLYRSSFTRKQLEDAELSRDQLEQIHITV